MELTTGSLSLTRALTFLTASVILVVQRCSQLTRVRSELAAWGARLRACTGPCVRAEQRR